MVARRPDHERIAITGVGLSAPNGNSPGDFRQSLLEGRSGVTHYETRYFGATVAGVCDFDELRHQRRKEVRRGTRAGSVGIYCAHEAVADAKAGEIAGDEGLSALWTIAGLVDDCPILNRACFASPAALTADGGRFLPPATMASALATAASKCHLANSRSPIFSSTTPT